MRMATAVTLCGLALVPAAAREITPAERRVEEYDTKIPACFDPAVLADGIELTLRIEEAQRWACG